MIDQELGSIYPATAQDFLLATFSCLPFWVSADCAWNEKLSWRALVQLHREPPVLEMKGFLQQLQTMWSLGQLAGKQEGILSWGAGD